MIFGRVLENEKKVEFEANITCTICGKKVPGGLKTGESYYKTQEFNKELENFKKNYLCGICRDKKRRN